MPWILEWTLAHTLSREGSGVPWVAAPPWILAPVKSQSQPQKERWILTWFVDKECDTGSYPGLWRETRSGLRDGGKWRSAGIISDSPLGMCLLPSMTMATTDTQGRGRHQHASARGAEGGRRLPPFLAWAFRNASLKPVVRQMGRREPGDIVAPPVLGQRGQGHGRR